MAMTTKQTIAELQSIPPAEIVERLTLPIEAGILSGAVSQIRLICEQADVNYELKSLGGFLVKTYFLEINNVTASKALSIVRQLQDLLEAING
jgi:hypothetical protein